MSLHDKLPTGDNLPGEGINENSILEESKNPSKAGEYFSFSEEQRKVHEELLNNSKELLQKAKHLYYDEIPLLSNEEIKDSLFAKCLKKNQLDWGKTWNTEINSIVNALMEYKKYDKIAKFLKSLDIAIPIDDSVKNELETLKNYFEVVGKNKEALQDIQAAIKNFEEMEIDQKERNVIKSNKLKNAIGESEKTNIPIDDSVIVSALDNPVIIINQIDNISINDVENFFKKFEDLKLPKVGITESRVSISDKIDYIKNDLVKKLLNAGQYKKALYLFDLGGNEEKETPVLESIFSMAKQNGDKKTIDIISQAIESMYNKKRFLKLKEEIENYLKLDNNIKDYFSSSKLSKKLAEESLKNGFNKN